MESSDRSKRKTFNGTVTSKMGDKSVKVTIPYKSRHPRYLKVINRKSVLHVHDEENTAKIGDRVEVMETRPMSRLKRFRISRIIERAPEPAATANIEVAANAASASDETASAKE